MNKTRRSSCRSAQRLSTGQLSAFTLVELLVVIAILSVLASLLVPTLRDGIANARKSQCAANLSAVAMGMATYAAGNNRRLVLGCGSGGGYPYIHDIYLDRRNQNGIEHNYFSYWSMLYGEFIVPECLYCPMDDTYTHDTDFPETLGEGGRVSYALRGITPLSTDPVYLRWGNFDGPTRMGDDVAAIVSDRFMWGARLHGESYGVAYSDGTVLTMNDTEDEVFDIGQDTTISSKAARIAVWNIFDQLR